MQCPVLIPNAIRYLLVAPNNYDGDVSRTVSAMLAPRAPRRFLLIPDDTYLSARPCPTTAKRIAGLHAHLALALCVDRGCCRCPGLLGGHAALAMAVTSSSQGEDPAVANEFRSCTATSPSPPINTSLINLTASA